MMTAERAARPLLGLLLAVLLAALPLAAIPAGATPAGATPLPRLGEYTHTLTFEVVRVAPLVSGPADHILTVVARATNHGSDPIEEIAYRFQRGDRIASRSELDAELADPSQPVTVINSPFTDMRDRFAPGETRTVVFSVPIAGDDSSTLAVRRAGVYPVMVNVNGTVETDSGPLRARIGELHLTVSVGAVPDSPPAATRPAAVQVLWPLVSTPHLAVGGIFRTDELAAEIAPGGRLDLLVTEWAQAAPDLVTAVIDPMLLDELDRMSSGYQVLAQPRRAQASLLPETSEPGPSPDTAAPTASSTGETGADSADAPTVTAAPTDKTVPGTGQADAARLLAQLRTLAQTRDIIVLPYADADIAALARADLDDEIATAVTRGREVAARVLGVGARLITDIAVPPGGRITDAAWQQLSHLGYTALILDRSGLKPTTAGAATITDSTGAGSWPVLATGAPHSREIQQILDSGTAPTSPDDIRALGAQWLLEPAAADIVIKPPRELTASPGALAALSRLTDELSDVQLITTRPVRSLLADAADTDTRALRYPAAAREHELPGDHLRRAATLADKLTGLAATLQPGDADPADILQPLTEALAVTSSASLRGNVTPVTGILTTGERTVDEITAGIVIQPDTSRYTLASTTAPLLLTIRNTLPYRVAVTVDLERTSQLGLKADRPEAITVDPGPRTVDIKIDTTVTRSGTFTVDAQLYALTEAGSVTAWGSPVPLTVDSRAYGTLTIVLMASAAGILALMVIWRLVQRVRGKVGVPEDAVLATPPADAPGGTR